MWNVIEQRVTPKDPAGGGDDRCVVRSEGDQVELAAVIDGATDKSGRDYGGMSGGALAAEEVTEALPLVATDAAGSDLIAKVTERLARMRRSFGIDEHDLLAPGAFAAIFLPRCNEIVRVGDVHVSYRLDGEDQWSVHLGHKEIDDLVAAGRKARLEVDLALGASVQTLLAGDTGREMMLSVLEDQPALANQPGPLGYGFLDGRTVPEQYIETFRLPDTVAEIVLASDGFLSPAPTYEDAERERAEDLRRDPLRIGQHASTKAPKPGAERHDDATYLRLKRSFDG